MPDPGPHHRTRQTVRCHRPILPVGGETGSPASGSDIIVCLQAGVAEQVGTEESPREVGTPIATARPRSVG
ncbi:hypothetical protein GCM10023162_10230 [Klenkia terrae]|uniref:hypothetical protein n=1 Tax=Klenkia terrae TaxID=1052259 RepID=UPI00336C6C73